jgi:tetratricopeptide (TPR) repeat protein/TolB-like protein
MTEMLSLQVSTSHTSTHASVFRLFALFACLMALGTAVLPSSKAAAQTVAVSGGRVVLVLPFDNRSGDPSLNWIGDSFPDTLNKRLESAGFLTISHDDRNFAYDHLGLPVDFQPSRATAIRIAQQLDANFIIIGSYNIERPATTQAKPGTDAAASSATFANSRIMIQARVLSLDELTLKSPVEDSAELDRLFDAENAIAWKAARVLDTHFNVAEPTFLAAPGAVPLAAFEDYIRGTNSSSAAERVKRLQASVALVPTYSAALLALGKEQFAQRDYAAAAATLAKVPRNDRIALEANFYLGLARFNTANYAAASDAFAFVASKLPLPEVINNQAVALSRQSKDGVALFQRASSADPSDEDYHYNLAVAFYRRGDTQNAIAEIAEALKLKPNDNEAVALKKQLASVAPGTKMATDTGASFTAAERIRRNYSETSFRQAAFLMDQMRSARLATLPPAQRAAEFTQQGRDYLAEGLLPEAEGQFQLAITADPNAYEAHAGLAQIRDASGDATQARSQAQLSNTLHPNASAWMVLARLDLAANQMLNCAEDVAHALQLEPNNTAAQAMKVLLVQRGQWVPTT